MTIALPSPPRRSTLWGGLLLATVLLAAACAPRTAPLPVVTTPKYPEFMFPEIPRGLAPEPLALEHQRGWLHLQGGDLRAAQRVFGTILRRDADFYPAEVGLAYTEMASGQQDEAISWFNRALGRSPRYVPALVGRGEALLAAGRDDAALQSFEQALSVQPDLPPVERRVEVLRVRSLQNSVSAARAAAEAGRLEDARAAYQRATSASPDSAFLYRELAAVEQQQDLLDEALGHARKAVELDPNDARALVLIGEIHEARGDLSAAAAAYEEAYNLDGTPATEARLADVRRRLAIAALPPEYHAIPAASAITRGQLAALLGVGLERLLAGVPARPVVVTDTRNHWAGPWILKVTAAGVMNAFPNHTFQPGAVVRRGDLAQVVSRVLDLAGPTAAVPASSAGQPSFADLGPGHLSYRAAARAVQAGVLPMLDGRTFQLSRAVSGAEAAAALERLQALIGDQRAAVAPARR